MEMAVAKVTSGTGRLLTWRSYVALTLLLAALVAYFVAHPENLFRAGQADGDGIYYYANLRSLFFDHDIDLSNDYQLLGNPFGMEPGPQGRVVNIYSIGPAFFWAPFMASAYAISAVGNGMGWMKDSMDGTSALYQRVTFFGSLVWGFLVIVLALLLLRQYFSEGLALTGALGLALATPLTWYMTRQPCFSHAVDAFSVAAFVFYWHRTLFTRRLWQWMLLGVLAGLAMLVRPQNAGFLLFPLGEAILLFVGHLRRGEKHQSLRLVGRCSAFLISAAVAFLPQMLAWNYYYGQFLTVPCGPAFLMLGNSKWAETLFSSRNGLFAWHPLVYGSILGLGLLPLRLSWPWRIRFFALLALVVFAFQLYINGAVWDWWAGWSFGGRRFSSCSILFAIGLTSLFWYLGEMLRRAGALVFAAVPLLVVAFCAVFNFSLMDDYLYGRARYAVSQEMLPLWIRAAERTITDLYDITGNPGSIPANWSFAAHTGVTPARYDAISGEELFAAVSPDRYDPISGKEIVAPRSETIAFASSPLVIAGFSEPMTHKNVRCRMMKDLTGTFVIPLRKPRDLSAKISLCRTNPNARAVLEVNGNRILDTMLYEGWQDYAFHVPASALRAGLNYAVLFQKIPESPESPIGQPSLAVGALTLRIEPGSK